MLDLLDGKMNGIHISPANEDIVRLGLSAASKEAGYEVILNWIKAFEKMATAIPLALDGGLRLPKA